jgi:hypothetical protein
MMEAVNPAIICCKNLCKCHSVPQHNNKENENNVLKSLKKKKEKKTFMSGV